jgi:hypothetical protein
VKLSELGSGQSSSARLASEGVGFFVAESPIVDDFGEQRRVALYFGPVTRARMRRLWKRVEQFGY